LDRGTLVAACLAIAVAQVGVALVAPILGVIQADLGASVAALAWIPAAFIVPTAILELNFGVLGDLFGRKRLLVVGGVLIMVGDLVAATSGALPQLITGQAIAGLGAAAIFPSSLAVLVAATPGARARARALSMWAVSLAAGAAVAPLISGSISSVEAWGWSFVPPAVLGLTTSLVCARLVVDSRQPTGRGLDWRGQASIAVSLLALLYAVIQGATDGYGAGHIVLAFVVATVAFVAFMRAEHSAAAPMLRLDLFRRPAFAGAAVVGLLGLFGFIGTVYALSIKLEAILHVSTWRAALVFSLIQAVPLLLTPVLPWLLEWVHPRSLLIAGLVALTAGQLWMAGLGADETRLTAMAGPILLMGVGFITMFSSLTAVAVGSVDIRDAGMASAVTSLVRETGQSLGPAVVSAIALGLAGSSLTSKLATSGLPDGALRVALDVNSAGGPLAVANADLGPVSQVVAPLARAALERGLDTGIYVCAAMSVLGALVAVLTLRDTHRGRSHDAAIATSRVEGAAVTEPAPSEGGAVPADLR
jgi:MFS family permease